MSVKRVSIDLWGTLIKSSPTFSEAKLKLTRKYFVGESGHFSKCYVDTKKELNAIIESTGWQPEQNLIFQHLFSKLEPQAILFPFIDDFIDEYQALAIEHQPILYSEETKEYLEKLSEKFTLNLSSNTLFIDSNSLRKIMEDLDIKKYFRYLNFSDYTKQAKPKAGMFNSHFHIGDNVRTDYYGAKAAGRIPFLINSTDQTIKDAYNFVIQRG